MNSLLRTSLGLLATLLILTFALGIVYRFSDTNGELSSFGFALVFFSVLVLTFLVVFGIDHFYTVMKLEWNEWIIDVQEMDWLYNGMYMTWLIYHNHKKWAKWNTILIATALDFFITAFAMIFEYSRPKPMIPPESFWTGWIIANVMMILFATTFYLKYTSVDRTPSPYPKGRLSDLPKNI